MYFAKLVTSEKIDAIFGNPSSGRCKCVPVRVIYQNDHMRSALWAESVPMLASVDKPINKEWSNGRIRVALYRHPRIFTVTE
jgi:hypothetical protein